jgi:hypothetical protein
MVVPKVSKGTLSKNIMVEASLDSPSKGTLSKDKALGEATKGTPNKDKALEVSKGTLHKDKEKALEACKGVATEDKSLGETK